MLCHLTPFPLAIHTAWSFLSESVFLPSSCETHSDMLCVHRWQMYKVLRVCYMHGLGAVPPGTALSSSCKYIGSCSVFLSAVFRVVFMLNVPLQMAQYNLFQKYHDCHPATHTPPIPTVSIQPAVSARVLRNICYRQRYLQDSYTASEEDIRATAAAILEAAQQLDGNPHAQSIWAHDASIADNATRKYVIKRNHAGFARKVIRLTVRLDNWQSTPSLTSLLQPSRHSSIQGQTHSRSNCDAGMSEVCQSGEKTSLQHEPPADNGPSGFVQTSHHTSTQKKRTAPSHESDAEIPLATQEAPLPSASEDIAKQTATQQQLSDKSHDITKPAAAQQEPLDALHDAQQLTARYQERVTQEQPLGELRDAAKPRAAQQQPLDVLHDAQQLLRAAERMLRESCGEDWLLQPLIPDMGTGEYRYSAMFSIPFYKQNCYDCNRYRNKSFFYRLLRKLLLICCVGLQTTDWVYVMPFVMCSYSFCTYILYTLCIVLHIMVKSARFDPMPHGKGPSTD